MTASHLRPSFFIIGANKCGTSSLYRYLLANPGVLPCAEKEPNFFGLHSPAHIDRHIDEYFALFPTRDDGGPLAFEWEASDQAGLPSRTTVVVDRRPGRRYITGEATASTFHEVPPSLLHRHLPDTKLIVVFRNPVERAFSHHRMYRRFTDSGHDLGVDVGEFETDVRREMRAHERGEPTQFVGPGAYVDLLQNWVAAYGASLVKVLITEDLGRREGAQRIMAELEEHLGLPAHRYDAILNRRFNHATPAAMDPAVRCELAAFYRPYNDRLRAHLGRELDWD